MADHFRTAVEDRLPDDYDRWDTAGPDRAAPARRAAGIRHPPAGFGLRDQADAGGVASADVKARSDERWPPDYDVHDDDDDNDDDNDYDDDNDNDDDDDDDNDDDDDDND